MRLIEVRGSDGKLIGACDAKCYLAEEERCECVCGGINHGVGLERAIDQMKGLMKDLTERWKEGEGMSAQVRVIREFMLGSLFQSVGG
jgi:alpha-galactosidase/6-phospho-beta-glucosidase family protein